MNTNVVATSREGEEEFDFNQWLIKHDLTSLKSLFLKYGATTISSLQITSPQIQRLMVDMEFLSKPQMVPKVVMATHQLEGQKEAIKIRTVVLSEREQAVIDDIKQKLNTVDAMEAEVIGLQSDYPKCQQRARRMKREEIERATVQINETFDALMHSLTERKQLLLNQLRLLNDDDDGDDGNGDDDEKKVDGLTPLTVCSQTIGDLRQFLKQKECEYNDSIPMKMSKEERQRVILKIGDDVNNRFGAKQNEIVKTTDMMKHRVRTYNETKIEIGFVSDGSNRILQDIRQFGAMTVGARGTVPKSWFPIYTAGRAHGGTFHRIYFFNPSLSRVIHPVYIKLNEVSSSMFRMYHVANDCEDLRYLDVAIPWEKLKLPSSLSVSFHYQTEEEWVEIPASAKLAKASRGFYYIHGGWQQQRFREAAERTIIVHLMNTITSWNWYQLCCHIFKSLELQCACYELQQLWDQQLWAVGTECTLVSVHRLQLLTEHVSFHSNPLGAGYRRKRKKTKRIKQGRYLQQMTIQNLFSIVRACVSGSDILSHDHNQKNIGVRVVSDFEIALREILKMNAHRITTTDRIYMIPCCNFFRFFGILNKQIKDTKRDPESNHDASDEAYRVMEVLFDKFYNQLNEWKQIGFEQGTEWTERNLLDALRVDLRMAELNISREYPLEDLIMDSDIDESLMAKVLSMLVKH